MDIYLESLAISFNHYSFNLLNSFIFFSNESSDTSAFFATLKNNRNLTINSWDIDFDQWIVTVLLKVNEPHAMALVVMGDDDGDDDDYGGSGE